MEMKKTPTIKGVFVNSHIQRLRKERGKSAVKELEERYGKSVKFSDTEDVPVKEEVKILEAIIDILEGPPVSLSKRSFEAGKLHFQNFSTTTFAKILFASIPKTPAGFEKLLLNSEYIVNNVFKNTNFESQKSEDGTLTVTMGNNDYPIEHFHGLFSEWLNFWGLKDGKVEAKELEGNRYEYTFLYKK